MQKKPIISIFAITNLALFLIYFLPLYAFESGENIESTVLAINYIQETISLMLPPVAAVCTLYLYSRFGLRRSLTELMYISLTSLIYTLPYYYLIGISGGLDSIESLMFALLVSIVYCLIFYLHVFLLFLAAKSVFKRNLVKEMIAELPPLSQKNITEEERKRLGEKAISLFGERLGEGSAFDLSVPITSAIFTASLIEFILYLAKELYSAVTYLISYAGDYRASEILTMVFSFIFILIMLFATQFACNFIKIFLTSTSKEED